MVATTPNPGPYNFGPFRRVSAIQWGAGGPPPRPLAQFWEGRWSTRAPTPGGGVKPECGTTDPLWSLIGGGALGPFRYNDCAFDPPLPQIHALQWRRNGLWRSVPSTPITLFDEWVDGTPACWTRIEPASNDPAVSGEIFACSAAHTTQAGENQNYVSFWAWDAVEQSPGTGEIDSPRWTDEVWLTRGIPAPAVIDAIPLIVTDTSTSPSFDDVQLRANAASLCPVFEVVDDGGIGLAGGALTIFQTRAALDSYAVRYQPFPTQVPAGDYTVTISAANAWNSAPSQTSFTWRFL